MNTHTSKIKSQVLQNKTQFAQNFHTNFKIKTIPTSDHSMELRHQTETTKIQTSFSIFPSIYKVISTYTHTNSIIDTSHITIFSAKIKNEHDVAVTMNFGKNKNGKKEEEEKTTF